MVDYTEYGTTRSESKQSKKRNPDPQSVPAFNQEVISRLKEGDHSSFELIFHAFYFKVRNFIYSLTKDMDIAEELSQQVFVGLWENRTKIDPARSFNSYVYVLAKNAALGHFRTTALHRNIEKQVLPEDEVVSADSEILAREAQLLVELAVGNMPRQRKRIYELSQVHNKSNGEIAAELNITRKAVEKHLRLAITDIRSVLQRFVSLMIW